MKVSPIPAWTKFKVGTPSTNGFNTNCLKFETVSHTSHVDTALSIIERCEIRPYLVFDESILNEQRILVSWLSPNYWNIGFRYGNIRFDFDFQQLIAKKRFYWVEVIPYQIEACRILVTDENHDGQLAPYNPNNKKGPWWYDSSDDQHYYNGNYCLEFMFEAPIGLRVLRKLDFVDHHSDYCSIYRNKPYKCSALGFGASRGGAVFLSRAAVTGYNLKELSAHFIQENGRPNDMTKFAFEELIRPLLRKKVEFNGDLKATSKNAKAVARAICAAFSYNNLNDAKKLASLFQSEDDCVDAVAMVVSKIVGLDDWEQLADT
jgi:hypothetical protein